MAGRHRRGSLAIALAPALLAALAGCGGFAARRNDPGTRAAAAVRVRLALADPAGAARGDGRIRLRLMPEAAASGPAIERELAWALAPDGSGHVQFRAGRDGLPPGCALFDDLGPGRYRLSSFLLVARLERSEGKPLLLTKSVELVEVPAVALAAGELGLLGALSIAIAPAGRYEYRLAAERPDEAAALEAALGARPDLARFRRADRAPVEVPPAPAVHAAPAAGPGPGAAPAGAAVASVAVLGLSASVGPALAGARDGAGLLRVEVRRIGSAADPRVIEAGWELEPPPPSAAAPDGAPDGGGDRGAASGSRALRLVAPGSRGLGGGAIAVPLALAPGGHEVVSIELSGTLRDSNGAARPVAAALDASVLGEIDIRPGEAVDLGTLAIELRAADRAALSEAAPERGEGPALSGVEGAARAADAPEGLSPVSRPLWRPGR